jgi:hypothetical protein
MIERENDLLNAGVLSVIMMITELVEGWKAAFCRELPCQPSSTHPSVEKG